MNRQSITLLALVLIVSCPRIHAEESTPSAEDEDKIAAKEDAESEEKMVLGLKTVFTGMLMLNDSDKPAGRGVIGTFACDDGKSYLLKAASDELLAQLKTVDQKKTTITGKLRVNGKYLIALAIVASTPSTTPRDKRKRNGL
jgi:hypothetical protein